MLKRILVVRFSSMGDVALLVPVIKSAIEAYDDVEITVVTRPKYSSLFYGMERVIAFAADVDHTYKGVLGMYNLFRALSRNVNYHAVIDMHDHIRTFFLSALFKAFGTQVTVFNKGRKEKQAFLNKKLKNNSQLEHTVTRYQQAFQKAGYAFPLTKPPYFHLNNTVQFAVGAWLVKNKLLKEEKWIGVAPFSMHASKIWPLENYEELLNGILCKTPVKFFLFGGANELPFLESLQRKFPKNCFVVANQLELSEEIALMQRLDLMICVDSSNMHLAALAGSSVLSIWGGTHPHVGFSPLGNNAAHMIQINSEDLPCRPCSIYGKATCHIGGFPCLTQITVEMVKEKALQIINKQSLPLNA